MTRFSDTMHSVGATFAQLEGDRQMERSTIYCTYCIKAILRRICGHEGPLKIKYSTHQEHEHIHSCCI